MRFAREQTWTAAAMPEDISMIGMQNAVKGLKEAEAAGADGVQTEIIK